VCPGTKATQDKQGSTGYYCVLVARASWACGRHGVAGPTTTYVKGNLIELEVRRRRLFAQARASRGLAGAVGQPRTQYGVPGAAVVLRQVHGRVVRVCVCRVESNAFS